RELKGAAIFMDPNNGEILCLVSAPSYDPGASLASLLRDRDSPLLNRAVMGQYPAGSIFKIVVALAGLETKKVSIETTFLCAGKLKVGNKEFNCWNRDGHGSVNLNSAITQSCNVYFYSLGILVGADKIYEYAEQFGFGRKTGVDLFGEADGFVPSRQWRHLEKKEKWYSGDTANLSIGQGELLVTPLQIARMVSVVANNGYLVEPHLIRRKGAPGPGVRKAIKLKIKNENLEAVKNAMKEVVGNVDGTGIRARSALFSISAKTGTAQAGPGLPSHAWIAGFAPSENPEISFVVFLERGGSGGDLPAEIARQALEYWWTHEKI
ncbi:MAG: penicillin-binding transpeptidase domain-containing protein, partial [Candidatus Omnitrophota bacterium]